MACSTCSNGITVFSDRHRAVGGARLSGYGPQAGSPFPAPWRSLQRLNGGNGSHAPGAQPPARPIAIDTLDHQQEQRALSLIKHRLQSVSPSQTNAAGITTHPVYVGLARGLQSRAARLAASQGGSLTPVQREQLASVNRQIKTQVKRAALGDYIAASFVLPDPLDTGTSVQDVASNNFPLMTGPPAPGQDQGTAPPVPTAPSSSPLIWLALAAGAWWFFTQKK